MNFANKVAIVTGGSSGIGAVTALAFARQGASVAIVGRNETRLKDIATQIRSVGEKPLIIQADVTKNEDLKAIVKNTLKEFGKIDILINNAGIARVCPIINEDFPKTYDEVMSANLRSAVMLTHLAAPRLITTKGNIVNISSVSFASVEPGFASYCTSKTGMDHFSRLSAMELARFGVRVNTVSPGPVQSRLLDGAGGTQNWKKIAEKSALKRLTTPEDVARLILYVANNETCKTVTGSTFKMDAGQTLRF